MHHQHRRIPEVLNQKYQTISELHLETMLDLGMDSLIERQMGWQRVHHWVKQKDLYWDFHLETMLDLGMDSLMEWQRGLLRD